MRYCFFILAIVACNQTKESNSENYFTGKAFKTSIRQWDTFIYNQDTSEFYFGTSMWDVNSLIPQNAQIEYKKGVCRVVVYNSNKDSGMLYSGFCKVYKGVYDKLNRRYPIVWWPFKQYVFYEDSVWFGYDKDGNVRSKRVFKYRNDTLTKMILKFDTTTSIEDHPRPFIGTRDMLFEDR